MINFKACYLIKSKYIFQQQKNLKTFLNIKMEKIRRNLKLFIQQETNILQTASIKSVHQLNDKFLQINDIYSFHNLIQEISNDISKTIIDKDKFCKFTRRLIQAICFAIQKYAYDFSRASYLVQTLNIVKKYWKKVLSRQFAQLTNFQENIIKNQKFLYVLKKNQFIFYVLRGSNVLIEKQIFRLIKNNSINTKSLFYLKKCFLKSIWQRIHTQMILIAEQTQNQTYLKIQLLTQFLKHTLFLVNFCMKQSDFQTVYQRLFELSRHIFRLIKKFYSIQIIPLIDAAKKIILKGLQIYKQISFQFPNKHKHLLNLINMFDSNYLKKKQHNGSSRGVIINESRNSYCILQNKSSNPKGYAVKLALRLLNSWKKVKSKKFKQSIKLQKSQYQSYSTILPKFQQKNQNQNTHQNFLASFDRQKYFLKNRAKRCISLQNPKISQLPVLHNVHIRKQIQQQIDKQFGKLKYLKNCMNKTDSKGKLFQKINENRIRSNSKNQKRSFSMKSGLFKSSKSKRKENNEQKQVDIQDYKQKLNLCRKQVNTLNQIRLYNPNKHSKILHGGNSQKNHGQSSLNINNNTKNILSNGNQNKVRLKL